MKRYEDSCEDINRQEMKTKSVQAITDGPGELGIIMSVFNRGGGHWYPIFSFGNRKKVSVKIESVGGNQQKEDSVIITGFVMLNDHNRQRYHRFTATYDVRNRTGEATFERECGDCGYAVNEYGFCDRCDSEAHDAANS